MHQNILSVEINKPVAEIFNFCLNPENTPLWVDSITYEEIDTPTPVLGTHYKNQSKGGAWNEYEVVEFIPNTLFTFKQVNGLYSVRYDFDELSNGASKLTYTEWVTEGEIENPFDMIPLQKLKTIIESN
jgi:hypothetical protein